MCGRDWHTCVVDGDTIWLGGVNLRLESYDTPEPYNDTCGSAGAMSATSSWRRGLHDNGRIVMSSGVKA